MFVLPSVFLPQWVPAPLAARLIPFTTITIAKLQGTQATYIDQLHLLRLQLKSPHLGHMPLTWFTLAQSGRNASEGRGKDVATLAKASDSLSADVVALCCVHPLILLLLL